MADRAAPGYRAWQQRVRTRALAKLAKLHAADWRRLLAEEQAKDPFAP